MWKFFCTFAAAKVLKQNEYDVFAGFIGDYIPAAGGSWPWVRFIYDRVYPYPLRLDPGHYCRANHSE